MSMDKLEERVRQLEDKVWKLNEMLRPRHPRRSRSRSRERGPAKRGRAASPARRVHVTNIPYSTDPLEERMRRMFGHCGKIVEIQCDLRNLWANLTFERAEDAEYCFQSHDPAIDGIRCQAYVREYK